MPEHAAFRLGLAELVVAIVVVVPVPGRAAKKATRPPVSCAADPDRGPCKFPDGVAPLVASGSTALATNFGLVLPTASPNGWDFVCEETFRNGDMARVQRHPDGRFFAPTPMGLWTAANDGCDFAVAPGTVGLSLVSVAFEPLQGGRIWALSTGAGRRLWVSSDDGLSFSEGSSVEPLTLLPGTSLSRLLIAPSDPARFYIAGYAHADPLLLLRSDDGGKTVRSLSPTWPGHPTRTDAGAGAARQITELLAVDPRAVDTVFIAVSDIGGGTRLLRSTDGGTRFETLVEFPDREFLVGFAIMEDGRMFAAASTLVETRGESPARLLAADRNGQNWQSLPSGPNGPRFRCLQASGTSLLACGTGEASGDGFLLGRSDDGGKTWSPVVRLRDIAGPRACAKDACAVTAAWLCDNYSACDSQTRPKPIPPATRPDTAAPPPPTTPPTPGCSCTLGGPKKIAAKTKNSSKLAIPVPMLIISAALLRARCRSRQGKILRKKRVPA